jgi:prenyltransferase beta subunit
VCLIAVPALAWSQSAEEKQATVAFLQKLQTESGGFRPAAGATSSLSGTASAVRALHYFGGTIPNREACANFVKSCWNEKDGGFGDQPDATAGVRMTAVGLMALVDLKAPTAPYSGVALDYLGSHAKTFEDIRIAVAAVEALHRKPREADAWIAQIEKMRGPDGAFGKGDSRARDTGGATVALLRLGVKVKDTREVVKVLNAGQHKDGAFGEEGKAESDLGTTYRVVRCYAMLDARPAETANCRAFIARCRNADGGYGIRPGQPSTVAATYFAGIVLHWLQDR